MPLTRLDRARGTLPEGYQFGDAGAYGTPNDALTRWQPMHVNAAARLTSAAFRITQAQIAADLHADEQ